MNYELKKHNSDKDWYWVNGYEVMGTALTDDVPQSLYCGKFSASVKTSDGGLVSLGLFDTHEEAVAAATRAMANNKTYAEWMGG